MHVDRVTVLLPPSLDAFEAERTPAEALILNLYLALQGCSDLALHVAADRGLSVPAGARDACRELAKAGILSPDLAKRLAGAVGLRNRIAHEYGGLDLGLVYAAARDDIGDLRAFAAQIARAYRLGE